MREGTFQEFLKGQIVGADLEEDPGHALEEMFTISEEDLPDQEKIIGLGSSFFLRNGNAQSQKYADSRGVILQFENGTSSTTLTAVYINNRIEVYVVKNQKAK